MAGSTVPVSGTKPRSCGSTDLRVYFDTPRGAVKAVDGVIVQPASQGSASAWSGESGSGKSTMALAMMRMIKPPGRIEAGEIWLERHATCVALPEDEMRAAAAGRDRDGPAGLDELAQPGDARPRPDRSTLRRPRGEADRSARQTTESRELLQRVGLRPDVADMFPHELSGGMKQRVCIAIAICLQPKVIIADEPTSALDVVVQRQVMETLRRVQEDLGASVILVGHDMGLMAQFVDRLGVMYAGKLVEVSPVADIFDEAAASVHAAADLQPAVARRARASSRAFPGCRRRCSTCRRAARSTRAARSRWSAAGVEEPDAARDRGRTSWAACHLL